MKCAFDSFISAKCDGDLYAELTRLLFESDMFRPVYQSLRNIDCEMPKNIMLPEGYGVPEPPTCYVVHECNFKRVKECIEGLVELSPDDCR